MLRELLFFELNRWTTVLPAGKTSPGPRLGHGFVCGADERLYLFGGFDGMGHSSIEILILCTKGVKLSICFGLLKLVNMCIPTE